MQNSQKHKINFHKEKIMGCKREIFKTSLMKGTKVTACTLLSILIIIFAAFGIKTLFSIMMSYFLQHKETTTYIIYISGFFSIIYSYWASYVYRFYFKHNTIITTTNIKISRTDFYVFAITYSGIAIEFMIFIFIIRLPFDWTLLAEQVNLLISIIINIFILLVNAPCLHYFPDGVTVSQSWGRCMSHFPDAVVHLRATGGNSAQLFHILTDYFCSLVFEQTEMLSLC
ncbi:hypothetical protein FSI66_022095 [Escherichia coli]|nr:hypothetical protein [Escherichia coli]